MTPEQPMRREELIRWIMDAARRCMAHYGFWFRDVEYQLGMDEALKIEDEAGDRSIDIQLTRLSKVMGFELKNGVPAILYDLSEERLMAILDALCANWLANDGVWFQTVENRFSMEDAKRCNDTCWSRFAPLEAYRIKSVLNLPERGGLESLKIALKHRLYLRLCEYDVTDETPNSFVFRLAQCRVQAARVRKGLDDYPCKSAGLVEYRSFVKTIDPRIRLECLACPPDPHPAEWFCAWKFSLAEN